MVTITLFKKQALFRGFRVEGHAGAGVEGQDIVCAAVSSASYLVANTILEVLGIPAEAKAEEGVMSVMLTLEDAPKAQDILKGFALHCEQLTAEYPKNVKVIYGGVK